MNEVQGSLICLPGFLVVLSYEVQVTDGDVAFDYMNRVNTDIGKPLLCLLKLLFYVENVSGCPLNLFIHNIVQLYNRQGILKHALVFIVVM